MQANLGLMFERKAKISCNCGRSVAKNLRARQDCVRTSRKTDFRQKNQTSARLKITFVDMTYPGQRPEFSSLSRHFLLVPIIIQNTLEVAWDSDHLRFYILVGDVNNGACKNNVNGASQLFYPPLSSLSYTTSSSSSRSSFRLRLISQMSPLSQQLHKSVLLRFALWKWHLLVEHLPFSQPHFINSIQLQHKELEVK